MGAFYNAIAFVAAFSMAPISRRFGAARVHATCLVLTGGAMIAIPGELEAGKQAWLEGPAWQPLRRLVRATPPVATAAI